MSLVAKRERAQQLAREAREAKAAEKEAKEKKQREASQQGNDAAKSQWGSAKEKVSCIWRPAYCYSVLTIYR